jgi:hypothetical protein
MIIESHRKKKKGILGVTVKIFEQKSKTTAKSFTVHGYSVDELYAKLKFFLNAIDMSKNKSVVIAIETED